MLSTKIISVLSILMIAVILNACGEKKTDTTQTGTNSGEKKTMIDTAKNNSQTQTQTQTQTQKKDTAMSNETAGKEDSKKSEGNVAKIETNMGTIKIKLYADKSPVTVANFKKLINEGFYNGIIFHRVIDGFMIQGGDPTGTGTGGSKETIKDEFAPGLKFSKKGLLAMANRGPNTGTSQFFITLAPTEWLDGKHTIFGEVVEGMDVVEKIGKTKVGPNDKPVTDVKMTKVTLTDK